MTLFTNDQALDLPHTGMLEMPCKVFSHVEVDKHNSRKGGSLLGIRASAGALAAAVGWTAAAQVPFLLFFAVSFGAARCAAWFAGVVLVNWLYNFGPRLSSNYAPLDLLCPCGLPPPT